MEEEESHEKYMDYDADYFILFRDIWSGCQ
jgi:hypothetical protein